MKNRTAWRNQYLVGNIAMMKHLEISTLTQSAYDISLAPSDNNILSVLISYMCLDLVPRIPNIHPNVLFSKSLSKVCLKQG